MEGSGITNWRPPPQGDQQMNVPVDGVGANNEWRLMLPPEARHRIVTKIMDTLKRHLPISQPEGLGELNKIAVRFEEKIYNAATSQADYLRKISMKMLTMEQKNPNSAVPNQVQSQNSPDTANNIQMGNQVSSIGIPISGQPQVKQILTTNIQNNNLPATLGVSTGMASALPSISGLNQSTTSNGQNSNMQAMPSVPQSSLNNSSGQGTAPNSFVNAQRQLHGRQLQQPIGSQQQQQSQNQLVYQQQQLLKQKVNHPSLMQSQMSQQQKSQSLLQASLQSQQPMMSMASSLQPSQTSLQNQKPSVLQSVPQNIPQSQQNPVQQGAPSIYQQQQPRQQQQQSQQSTLQQASPMLQQPSSLGQQTPGLSTQQQYHQPHMTQRHFSQQSSMSDLQQQQLQQQHSRLPSQQNGLLNMHQSQQTLSQENVPMHQQQLSSQNNLSGLQQQLLPQQQQQQPAQQLPQHQTQLLASQSNMTNMQQHQQTTHTLQHTKASGQVPQLQSALLQLQQGSQQQHMSQLQPQAMQLQQQQQQLSMQQQQAIQRELHQRHQVPGTVLQTQSGVDQQKQQLQTQRVLVETPPTSVDSTAQTSQPGSDVQEEIYQKIKSLKDVYFSDLHEMHQKIALKLQQHEILGPQHKPSEQLEHLKKYRITVDKIMQVLQMPKGNIPPGFKDKLPIYEKQIIALVTSNRKKLVSQQQGQQFQHPGANNQSMQQLPSQITQLQQPNTLMSQVQPMSMPTSVVSGQSVAVPSVPSGAMPPSTALVGSHTTSQNKMNSLQPCSNADTSQGSALNCLQQAPMGSLQQSNLGSLHQQSNLGQQQNSINVIMQNTCNMVPSAVNSLQQNSNTLQHQQLKQEQQLLQAQQIKQQFQQRHLQQHMITQQMLQQQQKHQMLQQQPQLQQHLLQQKQLQQQASQVQPHQMQQLQQINDMNTRHSGTKSGIFQPHAQQGQRQVYYQQQLKSSSPFSPQAPSPLMSQHASPQVDQQALPSLQKTGTPIQSATPPFVVSSPSSPLVPSPMPGDHEKPQSIISSLSNVTSAGQQQPVSGQALVQSLGTPGIPASPLLAELDSCQLNMSAVIPGKTSSTEQPIERLIKALRSASAAVLKSSINDIGSVVSMMDRIAGAAPGNGSRAAVGEDLVAMTKCRLQARNFMSQDGSSTTRKMKRQITAMPLNSVPSAGSGIEGVQQSSCIDDTEFDSSEASDFKRRKIEANPGLLDEIRDINQQLIDTVVDVAADDIDAAAEGGGGTVVRCTFCAVAISPNLKSQLETSADVSPILPLRLLIPPKYPSCPPIVLEKIPTELTESDDLSAKARSRFGISLRSLPQAMSLKDMARTWDVAAREVILEYARKNGGGSFSTTYGVWESCVSV